MVNFRNTFGIPDSESVPNSYQSCTKGTLLAYFKISVYRKLYAYNARGIDLHNYTAVYLVFQKYSDGTKKMNLCYKGG